MPFILWKTCSVFLRLKNGFQGDNLGNSLDREENALRENLMQAHKVRYNGSLIKSKIPNNKSEV